jgi:hypothetical protein
MESMLQRAAHRAEVNWAPRSDVMTAGTPNLATQPEKSALAQSRVVVEFNGMASGQREVLSIIVNRCVKPLDAGRGPTKSTWMWLN